MNRNKELSKEVNPIMISSIIDNNSSHNISKIGNQTKCQKRNKKPKMNTTKNPGSNGSLIIISSEIL